MCLSCTADESIYIVYSYIMPSPRSEESFPLLLLFLEEGKQSPRKKNGLFFDKKRYTRISEGASQVLTQWPGHVSACWITSSLLVLLFAIILILIVLGTLNTPAMSPRCLHLGARDNSTKIYLVHFNDEWHTNQFEAVEEIIKNYPNISIELILLRNSSKAILKRSNPPTTLNATEYNINVGPKNVIRKLKLNRIKVENVITDLKAELNLMTLLNNNPIIHVTNQSIDEYFAFTPLYSTWKLMNKNLLEFAARSVRLWEYGGISFKLPGFEAGNLKTKPKIRVKNKTNFFNWNEEEWTVNSLIKSNISTFNELPEGVVNIDNEGLHMETKSACHAFFGQVIANLRRAKFNATAEDIVKTTLKTFCLNGAVTDKYCYHFFMH